MFSIEQLIAQPPCVMFSKLLSLTISLFSPFFKRAGTLIAAKPWSCRNDPKFSPFSHTLSQSSKPNRI